MNPALTYNTVLTTQYNSVREAMNRILNAELAAIIPTLQWVLALYILVQFYRVMVGTGDIRSFVTALIRAVVIVYFLRHNDIYVRFIADNLFEKIPNALAGIAGSSAQLSTPARFDVVSAAIDNLTAEIRHQNTSWTVTAFGNTLATWLVNIGLQAFLAAQAHVWLVSIRLMAILLCLSPWLLLFEFFERTRGFFSQWLGIACGLICFQLGASIFLRISMESEMALLRAIQAAGSPNSIDMMISNLIHVGTALFGDALAMAALPMITAVAGGAGAHVAATRAASMMPGNIARAAGPAGRAAQVAVNARMGR